MEQTFVCETVRCYVAFWRWLVVGQVVNDWFLLNIPGKKKKQIKIMKLILF